MNFFYFAGSPVLSRLYSSIKQKIRPSKYRKKYFHQLYLIIELAKRLLASYYMIIFY